MNDIRGGLDPEQLEAVLAPRGPVCVLAGAGTGKTRTITRRIAHLVDSGQVNPGQVLAVTFTARAAGEMRVRLADLGIGGADGTVVAQTFHAAALRQLRYFWPMAMGQARWDLLDNKFRLVARAAHKVGLEADNRDLVRDLASEIEWAKASALAPKGYVAAATAAHRDLPTDGRAVAQVFREYERSKVSDDGDRLLDFEDLLIFTAAILGGDRAIAEEFRSRYRCFVVDEYQDVTPIQQNLLDAWLGGRDDLTVVGDANQTIYSFAGASPGHLLGFTRRFPDATLVRLQRDYRSTPQVVSLANRAIGQARGAIAGTRLRLIGQRPDGPEPVFREFPDDAAEAAGVVAEVQRLLRAGVPAAEIAVLYRINAQSENIEEALDEAGLAYQVRGDRGFFERQEIITALRRLSSLADGPPPPMPPAEAVRKALAPLGLTEREPSGAHARSRWQQLRRLAELADDIAAARPEADFGAVVAGLLERARNRHAPAADGITLSSLHAAKGLEWDAVLLTGLHEGSLPFARATGTVAEVEEERRLFYVGITRAREHLHLSWSLSRGESRRGGRKPSRFLDGLRPGTGPAPPAPELDRKVYRALRQWRVEYAEAEGVFPANVVPESMLKSIATELPTSRDELGRVRGLGSARIDELGDTLLAVVAANLG